MPIISLPIVILVLTVIQLQLDNDRNLSYVVTGLSGVNIIINFLNKFLGMYDKIALSMKTSTEFRKLLRDIEIMEVTDNTIDTPDSPTPQFTQEQLSIVETKMNLLFERAEGIVPEHIERQFSYLLGPSMGATPTRE